MNFRIEESWEKRIFDEFEKPYFIQLVDFVSKEKQLHDIFPPENLMFSAFDYCSFDKLKVVLLGQDPYHGFGQANGLCFSVNEGLRHPPSLKNIFKEIKRDLGKEIPESGNLERWAKQGVLMLNATLTVRAESPGSHQKKGWEVFTDAVIKKISDEKEGVVFILWGAYAQKKGEIIDHDKHLVLKAAHPSPFSADRGFHGCSHFSKTNEYLLSRGETSIDW
ncbi:MAG: uracil-DNA glycosylase [Cytophagaceae bacterium]